MADGRHRSLSAIHGTIILLAATKHAEVSNRASTARKEWRESALIGFTMRPSNNWKYQEAPLQNDRELREFITLLSVERVKSYLEIGGKLGGSLWKIGCSLPEGSRIVCVDLPHGKKRHIEELPHLEE